MGDLIEKTAELSGSKPPKATLPVALMKLVRPARPGGRPDDGLPAELRRADQGVRRRDLLGQARQGERELGYSPRDLETGLKQTLDARLRLERARASTGGARPRSLNGCPAAASPAARRRPRRVADPARVPDRVAVRAERRGRRLDLLDPAVPEVAAVVDHVVVEQLLDPALHAERVALRAGSRRPWSAQKTPSALVSKTGVVS